ncbi:MAG: cation-efflux pump, partial [Pygmaiobacter sp.]
VDVMQSHDTIDDIERAVWQDTHVHLVLHFDPINVNDTEVSAHRTMVRELLAEIDPALSMHDFRMVKGPQHTNLIFDVLVPEKFALEDGALKDEICERVRRHEGNHFSVVTIDHSFTGGNDPPGD